jgi:hypothetical protein
MSMPVQADSELGYILSAAGRPAINLSTQYPIGQSFKQIHTGTVLQSRVVADPDPWEAGSGSESQNLGRRRRGLEWTHEGSVDQ